MLHKEFGTSDRTVRRFSMPAYMIQYIKIKGLKELRRNTIGLNGSERILLCINALK